MKKIILILIITLFMQGSSFAVDSVQKTGGDIKGRITDYIDGLVSIKEGGIDYTITRSKNDDFYGDYIKYRKSPFSKATEDAYCRVTFVDAYSVEFETPTSKVKIPRYRVKELTLNYN